MDISIAKEIVNKLTTYDLDGGKYLFDVKPNWKDAKFILYPVNLKEITQKEKVINFQSIHCHFVNQVDYKKIKSIFRLMYFTNKL